MYFKKQVFILAILGALLMPSVMVISKTVYSTGQIVYAQANTQVLTNSGEDFYGDNGESSNLSKGMQALVNVLDEGQVVMQVLIGIGLATSTLAFVINAFKLGKSGDAKGRAEATKNLIIISITTASLSAFSFIYQIIISMIIG